MIEKLTKEQEDRFQEFVDRWIDIGTCTDPANRQKAEKYINMAYEIAGLEHPNKIVWCDSPLAMILTHDNLKNNHSVGASVRDSVWGSVRDSVWGSVWDSVWDSVGTSVRDSVWGSVRASVWASVGASVRDSVWGSVRASVGDSVYGQHDSDFLSFYDYFYQVCDLTGQTNKLKGLWGIAKNCGWWLPCEDICFVSERHNICKLDDNKVIHCEDGPAIAYPDGFEIYAWHGTVIPKEWITDPESLTPEMALTHKNVEQRRCIAEILGWNKVLGQLESKLIDEDDDPEIGKLIEVDIPDIGRERFLQVTCGTGRNFALPVPPDMKTAIQANAWTWGLDDFEYTPEVRT